MAADHTTWACAETEERLSDFADGLLAADELAAFERHRAGCSACAALSARVGATVSEMRGMALLEEPPELVRSILDRTIGARDAKHGVASIPAARPTVPATRPADSERGWFDWLSAIAQPQFAYGAAAVLISVVVVSHALGIRWRQPTVAELQPASIYREANRQGHLIYARGTKYVSDSRVVYEIQSAFEGQQAPDSAPQPKPAQRQAPGQTEIAPHVTPSLGPRDPSRASHPINLMRRAAAEAATLVPGINPRSVL
ncbi:MAG: anti-sigma factor [Candidatus Acidiferrales bacterium]